MGRLFVYNNHMNYLKELLESYSKLKCRKLKLLEQGIGGTQVTGNNPQERIKFIEAGAAGGTSSNPNKFIYGKQSFSAFITKPRKNEPTGHVTIRVDLGAGSKNFTAPYQGLEKYLADHRGEGEDQPEQQQNSKEKELQPQQGQEEFNPGQVVDSLMQSQPGMAVAQSPLAITAPEAAQRLMQKMTDISQRVGKVWDSLTSPLKKFYKTQELFASRFVGAKGSLESQIANALVVKRNSNGELISINATGDEYVSLAVAESLDKILEITSKREITDDDKILLDSLVSRTSDGEIMILDSGGTEGMLFRASKSTIQGGTLGAVLSSFEERFKFKIKEQDPETLSINKEDSQLQSAFFEDIASLLALGSTCKQGMDSYKFQKKKGTTRQVSRSSSCSEMIKYLMGKYAQKSERLLTILTPITELERGDGEYAMVIPNDSPTMSFLKYVIKNGTKKMYQAVIRISKHALESRKAERSIPKGAITKNGERADATEVWSTREQLQQALLNSGITQEEIDEHGFIKEITIEEAYGPTHQKLRNLDKDYDKNQKVFILDVSYKNYLSLSGKAKTGSGYATSRNRFFNGNLEDLNKEWYAYLTQIGIAKNIRPEERDGDSLKYSRRQLDEIAKLPEAMSKMKQLRKVSPEELESDRKFRKTMAKNLFRDSELSLDIGSDFLKEMAEYNNKSIEYYYDIVKNIPANADTLGPDGKKLKRTEPLKDLANTIIDQLIEDSTYSELFGRDQLDLDFLMDPGSPRFLDKEEEYRKKLLKDSKEDKKELYGYLKQVIKPNKGESNEDLIIRAKGAIARYLKNKKLQKDLASDDAQVRDKAKKYLAIKFFLAGGSNSDSLLCDFRELYGKDNFVFRQNEGFAMLREWLQGNERYDMIWNGNTFTLYDKEEDDVSISCSDAKVESDRDKENGIQSSITSVSFSRGLLKKLDKRKKSIVSSVNNENNTGELLLEFLQSQKEILTKLFKIIAKDG